MKRNWFVAAVVIGIVAIVVAAVVMRLTEDAPPTTSEWTESVCSSLVDWRDSMASLADLSGEPLTADSLRDRLDAAEAATTDLVTELRDLGPPDLDAGDELEEQLDQSVGELESSFESLKNSAEDTADAPPSEFLQELAGLASDAAALQDAIGSTVSTLENANVAEESRAELQQAFANAPSCQSLRTDS